MPYLIPRGSRFLAFSIATFVALSSAIAHADIISFTQGVNGYSGARDTYVEDLGPDADNSANPVLTLQGFGGFPEGHGLVQFRQIWGNGAGQIRAGSQINSATLTVGTWSTSGNTINGHEMLINWQDTATWNSVGSGIQANDVEAKSAVDFTFNASSAQQLHNVDVTATVQGWASNQASSRGWVFYNVQGGTYRMASSEQAQAFRPTLTIDWTAVPEPSSVAFLIGLGSVGLVGGLVRRRRAKKHQNA